MDKFRGTKYDGSDVAVIAQQVRADIKAAVAAGELPNLKTSVRISRFAGGCSLDVTVTACDLVVLNVDRVLRADALAHTSYADVPRYAAEGLALRTQIEGIVAAYNRDNSDSMVDLFDVHFYSHVTFASELESAQREAILAQAAPAVAQAAPAPVAIAVAADVPQALVRRFDLDTDADTVLASVQAHGHLYAAGQVTRIDATLADLSAGTLAAGVWVTFDLVGPLEPWQLDADAGLAPTLSRAA